MAGKGRKLSEETRMKMSLASKGKPKSAVHAQNIKIAKAVSNFAKAFALN